MDYSFPSDMEQSTIVGLRFHPTDHELVYKYLKEKLEGLITDCEDIVEINIYDFEPFDLPDHSRSKSVDDVFYFFCARNFKSLKTRRSTRTTRGGYWKPTGKPRVVKHKITKKEIGTKRSLVFHLGRPKGTRTGWIMHEYEYTGGHLKGGNTAISNQGDFVLCKIKRKSDTKNGKSLSSFSTLDSTSSVVASTPIQNVGGLPMTSMVANKDELGFNPMIPLVNQTEAGYPVASFHGSESGFNTSTSTPPNHLVSSPDKSESNCFNIDIFFDFGNDQTETSHLVTLFRKSESSFNILTFATDETEPNHLVVSSNKSESSFNINTSSDFLNGNGNQSMDNAVVDASFGSALPYEKADESESSCSTSISSTLASKEANLLATNRNEDSYAKPSDLGNHIPDKSLNVSYNSACVRLLDFEDQSTWTSQALCGKENQSRDLQHGDCHAFNYKEHLKYDFQEESVQEGDFSQLLLSSTNCKHPETSMDEDFNQNQLMRSDIPMMDSELSVLEEFKAFHELENIINSMD